MGDSGIVKIHGKEYKTVALRVSEFRKDHPDWSLKNEIIENNDDMVIMQTTILDNEGRFICNGYAQEVKNSTNINKTSALENCETSACGRALSFLGYAGSEIASADEITQDMLEQTRYAGIELGIAIERHKDTIQAVKEGIATNDLSSAVEAVYELDRDEFQSIWVAPSKGGPFTTAERDMFKTEEWIELRKSYYEGK